MFPFIVWLVISSLILYLSLWFILRGKSKWYEIFAALALILILGVEFFTMSIINNNMAAIQKQEPGHQHPK